MSKLKQSLDSLRTFFIEVKLELIKCSWPTRKELLGQSMVVIVSVILLGAFVWLCDVVIGVLLKYFIQ
jgi:preprotein translocase subunit SecE